MGSGRSKALRGAGWANSGKCDCHSDNYRVLKKKWLSVPLFGKVLVTTARFLTLGIT